MDDTPRSFTIAEIGLSNRQVWAATLTELAQHGAVSVTDLEAWLRPASLIGGEGEALVLGVPNTTARDRITARLGHHAAGPEAGRTAQAPEQRAAASWR